METSTKKNTIKNIFGSQSVQRILILFLKIIILFVIQFLINSENAFITRPIIVRLLEAIALVLVVNVIISIIEISFSSIYITKKGIKLNAKNNFLLGIGRIANMLNIITIVFGIMIFLKINVLHFITSISIVAAAIALLTKDYITNMINGLIIMFSDRLSLGDHIILGQTKGKIQDLTFINVIIENEDGDTILLPNTVVLNSVVINQSKQEIKRITIDFEMPVEIKLLPDEIEHHLRQSLWAYNNIILTEGINMRTKFIHKDYVLYQLKINILNTHRHKEFALKRTINTAIISMIHHRDQEHSIIQTMD